MAESSPNLQLDLPPPTAPESIPVSLRGFGDAAQAGQLGNRIGEMIRGISRFIDLERLDGVTIAYDYDEALAQLDRGYQSTRPLTRTADGRLLGVAMAPAVLRDGTVKGHLLFHAPFVLPLMDETSEHFQQALYLIAHECGHIEDLKHRDESFPGTILQRQITDYEEAVLDQVAGALWEEYAACRASAPFGHGHASVYESGLVSVLPVARDEANAAIRSYRCHGNINRVLEEAGRPLCEPLRMAAYLLGHLDGIAEDWNAVPRARDALAGSPYQPFVDRLIPILRGLWSRRGRWASTSEFMPLHDVARAVLAHGGLILLRQSDGTLYVDIPFTRRRCPECGPCASPAQQLRQGQIPLREALHCPESQAIALYGRLGSLRQIASRHLKDADGVGTDLPTSIIISTPMRGGIASCHFTSPPLGLLVPVS